MVVFLYDDEEDVSCLRDNIGRSFWNEVPEGSFLVVGKMYVNLYKKKSCIKRVPSKTHIICESDI